MAEVDFYKKEIEGDERKYVACATRDKGQWSLD